MGTLIELEVGAGPTTERVKGRLNCDLYPHPNIDVVFDLMKSWPFKDNSVRGIHANHVLEHLPDPDFFMQESWRVLAEPAILSPNLFLRLPYGPSEQGIGDITHLKMFSPTSFACWWPSYIKTSHNLQYKVQSAKFALFMVGMHINPKLRWMAKPIIRWVALRAIPFLWSGWTEMVVQMGVIKSERHLAAWDKRPESAAIPMVNLMWEDEYYNRPIRIPRRYVAF